MIVDNRFSDPGSEVSGIIYYGTSQCFAEECAVRLENAKLSGDPLTLAGWDNKLLVTDVDLKCDDGDDIIKPPLDRFWYTVIVSGVIV